MPNLQADFPSGFCRQANRCWRDFGEGSLFLRSVIPGLGANPDIYTLPGVTLVVDRMLVVVAVILTVNKGKVLHCKDTFYTYLILILGPYIISPKANLSLIS
jgi:hypothetical protein